MYFQLIFALDRVKVLAPQHPEWKDKEPFASLLKGDIRGALAGGERAMLEIVMGTHAGMTTAEFEQIVKDWIATAKHPRFKRPYTECVYQPMLELLAYLRATASRPSSFPAAASSSCGRGRKRSMAFRPNRWLAAASRRNSSSATASRAGPSAGGGLHRRQGGKARRHQRAHRPSAHRRVWQLGRRPADAGMDASRPRRRLMLLVHHDDAYANSPTEPIPRSARSPTR